MTPTLVFLRITKLLTIISWMAIWVPIAAAQELGSPPDNQATAPAKSTAKDADGWRDLLPKEGLDGWEVTDFYGHGTVERKQEVVILEPGKPMTGINYKKDFPKTNYEVQFEANRTKGNDFLCGLTFPVGKEFCSFIGGGWGGGLVGLSSIDGADASENSTSSHIEFKNGTWYTFRLRVDDEFIRGWVNDKEVLAQEREDHAFSTRIEVYASQPLGLCVYQSRVELRNLKWRALDAETGKPVPQQ